MTAEHVVVAEPSTGETPSFPYSRRYLTGVADPPVALATGQVRSGTLQLLPFAIIVGAAFLGEAVAWYEPVGGVLILAGAASSETVSTARAERGPRNLVWLSQPTS